MSWWLPLAAWLLDRFFADPQNIPHPVQGIAWLAARLEEPARRMRHPVFAGGLVLGFLLLVTIFVCGMALSLPPVAGVVSALYLAWSGLALEGLVRSGKEALAAISLAESLSATPENSAYPESLNRARQSVQMLVSRDTANMETPDLYRSLAETVSENFNDAFVAPFFWLCIAGPVGLWTYKAVSTMDSMWGYKTERWLYLGRVAAKLDDWLAYVPARLSVVLLLLSARADALLFAPKKGKGTHYKTPNSPYSFVWPFAAMTVQARRCDSPNAGWPMAAAAWLFNGRSGGPTPYHGKLVNKPLLGSDGGMWTTANLSSLINLTRFAGGVTVLLFLLLQAGIAVIFDAASTL